MLHERQELPNHGTMEDYTTPFLVVAGVLCWIALVTVWVAFGFFTATIGAFIANAFIPNDKGDGADLS